ncbi:hypothetical protein ACLB2K_006144 [Fragaria x ananassa]
MPRSLTSKMNCFRSSLSGKSLGSSEPTEMDQQLLNIHRQTAMMICKEIERVVANNSTEGLLSIELRELNKFVKAITDLGFDSSKIEAQVEKLNESIAKYKSTRSACIPGLAAIESRMAKASSNRQDLLLKKESLDESLKKLKTEQELLEEEIDQVDLQIKDHDMKIDRMNNERAKITEAPNVTSGNAQTLKALEDSIEAQRSEFEGLTYLG